MNVIEWSEVVFINENITIPYNTVLTIRDNATIVFYADNQEKISKNLIITVDRGDLKIGSGVKFVSLGMFTGSQKPPTLSYFNTDAWGFYFRFYLGAKNTPNTLNFNGIQVLKTTRLQRGNPTFKMEGPTPITILKDCLFDGGFIAFEHEPFSHPEASVFGADSCEFRNMESVIENPKGGPTCFIEISFSILENMGIAVNYKGGSGINTVKGVEFYSNIVRNVVQGIYSTSSAIVLNSVFENFRVGVVSPIISVFNVTFENTKATMSGIAILNNIERRVATFDITNSRFVNILGVVIASDKAVSSFTFTNNSIFNCEGTPDFSYSLIHLSQPVNQLLFQQNTILNSVSISRNIIHFGALNENISISNNIFRNNRARCLLFVGEALSEYTGWSIRQNSFEDVVNTPEKNSEVCFGGKTINNILLNVTFNYWGPNVDKSKNLDPVLVFNLISDKLYPSNDFLFVPYFRTSNVDDNSPSNIGTYIPPHQSPNPTQSPNGNNPSLAGLIVGVCVIVVVLVCIVCTVVIIAVIFLRRRNNYKMIN